MTRLSVNVNKIATLRNARGENVPNLVQVVRDVERFGAEGITVHPRPDERHIRYQDVKDISSMLTTEFNIEGFPNRKFIDLVLDVKPAQVTLVPDSVDVLTSNSGWDTLSNKTLLNEVVAEFKNSGIRTSIFVGTELKFIEGVKDIGADRVELYTEPYARTFATNKEVAVESFKQAAEYAHKLGLGVNAGHDLNLDNLMYFSKSIQVLKEVSIGHALISDSLYFGLENTIQMYLAQLNG